MGKLYVAKEFGRYHYFKDEAARTAFIKKLTPWEQKFVEVWESCFGKDKDGGKK
jgi:hypothetical protein